MSSYSRATLGRAIQDFTGQDPSFRTVAYFSMEIGIKSSIPTYAGGLGLLAGDMLKSAADLGVPMVGVTLLYRKGYFEQAFTKENWQIEKPSTWDPAAELTLLPNQISVSIQGRDVRIRAWSYEISGLTGYTVPIYFLDTDFELNQPEDRQFTWSLYGGDILCRLCQEIILGVGGLRILRDLGYNNIETFHLNEGHAGFLTLELMREMGYYDPQKVREQVVFTTHTPVAAGHDYFKYDLIEKTMSEDALATLKHMMPSEGVSMTELGFRYSHFVNGVSKKHAEVSRKLFNVPNIQNVTNGIHPMTWISPGIKNLLSRHIPGWENEPGRLIQALALPSDELWKVHQASKMRLLTYVLEETGWDLKSDILTIGFARRAATYKRADLIFSDIKRLTQIGHGKLQLIFSGKAHPKDEGGKALIQEILNISNKVNLFIPIIYLPNYTMDLGRLMTQGVDLWLNTPLRPREASGTSGMKCALNGVMNFSVLDGWWIEGWIEDITGWSIGPEPSSSDLHVYNESQDALDLFDKLEKKIIPTYYDDRNKWINMMKNTIAINSCYFHTHRVVKEYCEKAYGIAFRGM
ncbi:MULTISPECIES: alpha-glucan family phosphorylase [Aminobacterium]|uniref:alpha-glucan family phosphorylase n=2 Tax=Aminobacteriaceae TaxID=3029087 RepID=UPI002579EEC9|nr:MULTISPECIES: alpha-glucan family phosphorylase [unclassified Aminobacterium]